MAQRRKKASSKPRSQLSRQREEILRQLLTRERALRKQALAREKEALDRQAATSDILKVISGSPADVAPVFDAIAERARVLCGASLGYTTRFDGKLLHLVGYRGVSTRAEAVMREMFPRQLDRGSVNGRAILAGEPVQIVDVRLDPEHHLREQAKAAEFRSMLAVPMLLGGEPIGAVGVARKEPGAFSDRLVSLIKTFADQAVVAIENARLFNETKEALERQTATSNILGVISSSPTELAPVFDAILSNATTLCDAHLGVLNLFDGEELWTVAHRGTNPEFEKWVFERGRFKPEAFLTDLAAERRPVHIADIRDTPFYREGKLNAVKMADLAGARTFLAVPLLKKSRVIGAISVYRPEVRLFTDKQIALVSTFANQAVIAIENVRLFNETKEALEQQTATGSILRVIAGSPTNTQPVFEAVCVSAARLCNAYDAIIFRVEGEHLVVAGHHGAIPVPNEPLPFVRDTLSGRAAIEQRTIHAVDLAAETKEYPLASALARQHGIRTALSVPLIREGIAIGVIHIRRQEARAFSEKQIHLLNLFADQALIAIENVRLFNETKEALEQQIATAEILKVISGTPTDAQPVFDAIAKSALHIFGGMDVSVGLAEGDLIHIRAGTLSYLTATGNRIPLDRNSYAGRAILDRAEFNIADIEAPGTPPVTLERGRKGGWRSIALVPMVREGVPIGHISVHRKQPVALNPKQFALLRTFAAQAVIAIENVRLFNETREALEQQKASADVLSVISGSIADTTPVFEKILDSCERLFEGHLVGITVVRPDGMIDRAAYRGPHEDEIRSMFPMPLSRDSASGNAILDAKVVHYPDIEEPGVPVGAVERFRMAGTRAIICAPMLFEGQGVGAIWVGRKFAAAFTDKQIALLRTFADQAAIAIQNVKLFREIQEKSAQLEVASEHKSHFLASMSHELRTPLNAILGFNEMLLDEVYGELSEDVKTPLENMQASGKHLLRLINNVLDLAKIEAGRMELALTDYSVQDTVESVRSTLRPLAESKGLELLATVPQDLPLAYGDPGRITQCLMNLAGNSLKFTKEGRVEISVQQQNGQLRYCVADTGIGIPPDKIGSLFTEFKQTDATIASEYGGTGLGLSITKKFIEMHGGRIWVESEPGTGSTFTFEVPLRAGERNAA